MKSKNQVYSVGNYLMTGKVLGKGHFARVEEATHRIIGKKVRQGAQANLHHFSILIYIPLTLYPRRGSRGISDINPRHPRFTKISYECSTDVTGGKPIAVLLQSYLRCKCY
jgi:hypothetical protein